jgi:hypothetical protein
MSYGCGYLLIFSLVLIGWKLRSESSGSLTQNLIMSAGKGSRVGRLWREGPGLWGSENFSGPLIGNVCLGAFAQY